MYSSKTAMCCLGLHRKRMSFNIINEIELNVCIFILSNVSLSLEKILKQWFLFNAWLKVDIRSMDTATCSTSLWWQNPALSRRQQIGHFQEELSEEPTLLTLEFQVQWVCFSQEVMATIVRFFLICYIPHFPGIPQQQSKVCSQSMSPFLQEIMPMCFRSYCLKTMLLSYQTKVFQGKKLVRATRNPAELGYTGLDIVGFRQLSGWNGQSKLPNF